MQTRAKAKDFDEIRERLERLRVGAPEGVTPSREEATRILDERARSLARVTHDATKDARRIDVVVFTSHGERYAIETSYVRETVRSRGTTPVPGTPAWIAGIESIRGEILAVVDLAPLFGAQMPPPSSACLLLVIGDENAELALRCDEISDVSSLGKDPIVAPPRAATSGGKRDVVGVTHDGIVVLDAAALLEDPRLVVEQMEENEV